MRTIYFYLFCIALLFATHAQSQVWLGAVNSDWKNAANWAPANHLTIPANATHWPVLDDNTTVNSLVMEPGSRLYLNGHKLEITTNGDQQLDIQGATIEGGGILEIKGEGTRIFDGNTINGNLDINIEGSALFKEATLAPNVYNGNITFNINGTADFFTSTEFASTFNGNMVVLRTVPGHTTLFVKGFTALDGDLVVSVPGGESFLKLNPAGLPLPPVSGKFDLLFDGMGFHGQFIMHNIKNNQPGGKMKVKGYSDDWGGMYFMNNNNLLLDSLILTDFLEWQAHNNSIKGHVYIHHRMDHSYFRCFDNNFYGNVTIISNVREFNFIERGNVYHGDVDFTVTNIADVDFDFEDNVYYGNLSLHIQNVGTNRIFPNKTYSAIHGNLTVTGFTSCYINPNRMNLPTIGGQLNIDISGGLTTILGIYRMKHATGGGRIAINNVKFFSFENNEVIADSLVFTNFGQSHFTGEPQNMVDNNITGHIRIDGFFDNRAPVTVGRNNIKGNVKIIMPYRGMLWDLGNEYEGDVEYHFADKENGELDPATMYIGKESAPFYRGNVTIHNQNRYNFLQIFPMGLAGLDGDFTYVEEGGFGDIYINQNGMPCATISGKVDIRCMPASTLNRFFMTRLKNSGGGSVFLQNIRSLSIISDTLVVDYFVARNLVGISSVASGIMQSMITGDVHLEDLPASQSDLFLYGNVFNGNTTVKLLSNNQLIQGFFQPDIFNGSATFESLGNGQLHLAYLAPVYFNGSVYLKSTTALSFTDTVNFGGSSDAEFDHSGPSSVIIPRLRINKAAGTALAILDTITVSQKMEFLSGVINASASPLRFGLNASHEGASAVSHVVGKVLKEGGSAFTFPLGNYNTLNTVSITEASTDKNLFGAQYLQRDPSIDGYSANLFQQVPNNPIQRVSRCEYWIVERISGIGNAGLIFSFNQRACPAALGSYITDPGKAKIVRWNGTMWQDLGNGGYSGSNAGTITTGTVVSAFSAFTLASTDTEVNPLPMKLLSFHAVKKDAGAQLVWETENEVNVQHYELQRAGADNIFTTIAIVAANNSLRRNQYNAPDNAPLPGINYYRLKSVDLDGSFTFSKTVFLNFSGNSALQIWPNPVARGNNIKLSWPGNVNTANVSIYNSNGQLIRQWQKFSSGVNDVLPVNDPSPGMYILRIATEQQSQSVKLVIQ